VNQGGIVLAERAIRMAQKNIRGERIPLPPNVVACERPGEPGAL
jgi:hypothetical protein